MALVKIAALWKGREGGKVEYTGMMDSARIIVLPNSKKDKEKSPDAYVYITVDEEGSKYAKKKKEDDDAPSGDGDDEIPF